MCLVTYLLISIIQLLVEILSVQIKYFCSLLPRDSCEVGVASRWLLAGGIYNSSETKSAILDPPNRYIVCINGEWIGVFIFELHVH